MKTAKIQRGITLVALIITIIVLLILAVVTIREVTGDGIIAKAKEARAKYENAAQKEADMLAEYERLLPGKGTVEGNALELFEKDGEDTNKLHVGDFINYDAGTWTQEEIDAIETGVTGKLAKANNSTSMPTEPYQFGGFTVGSSRNGSGWRVFDVSDTGEITLISASCPEYYYHDDVSSCAMAYIMTNDVEYLNRNNKSTDKCDEEPEGFFKLRDWRDYIKSQNNANIVKILTADQVNNWYKKYIGPEDAIDTWGGDYGSPDKPIFRKIYGTKYQTLIDCGISAWIPMGKGFYGPEGRQLYLDSTGRFTARWQHASFNAAHGIRVMVVLSSSINLEKTLNTKTLDGYTFNVWNIK